MIIIIKYYYDRLFYIYLYFENIIVELQVTKKSIN